MRLTSVTLPPGLTSDAANPASTGKLVNATIGIAGPAALMARAAAGPMATTTVGPLSRTLADRVASCPRSLFGVFHEADRAAVLVPDRPQGFAEHQVDARRLRAGRAQHCHRWKGRLSTARLRAPNECG